MLRVNVGMSRKVSKDYNSTGFSINLEGEIALSLDDPQVVVEKIKELYDFAEESLSQQIERHNSEAAIASRDYERAPEANSLETAHPYQPRFSAPAPQQSVHNGPQNRMPVGTASNQAQPRYANSGRAPETNGSSDIAATNKQLQFMLTLGKRQGMNQAQVEQMAADILGRPVGLYEISKQEANQLITQLNSNPSVARRS